MRNLLFFLMLVMGAVACNNDAKDSNDPFVKFDSDPTEEHYAAVMNELMNTIRDEGTTSEERNAALDQGYEASLKMKKTPQAIGFLNTYIKENFEGEDTPDRLLTLAGLLKEAGKQGVSQTIAQGFLVSFPNHPKAGDAKAMIPESAPSISERINELGGSMFDMDAGKLKEDVARSFVDVCEAYALSAPGQADVPDFLHKAAETARTMRTLPKAVSIYDWILEDYPNHEKAPQALFLKAFTYDNNLNDTANARKYYSEFLNRFPEDEFADDTQFLLENLGKSDEEMLEALTKKKAK